MSLILSLLSALWFQRELIVFPEKAEVETRKIPHIHKLLLGLCLLTGFLFRDYSLPILLICLILTYLSLIDYGYYLTDSQYLLILFALSLADLLFYRPLLVYEHILNLFFILQFFLIFRSLVHFFLKKEGLGMGDVLLFIALAPLFALEQMILLVLFSALFGLCFALGYFLVMKKQLERLPFIPFISLSTFSLIIAKIPHP